MTAAALPARRRAVPPLQALAVAVAACAFVLPLSAAGSTALGDPLLALSLAGVIAALALSVLSGGAAAVAVGLVASHLGAFALVRLLSTVAPDPGVGYWAALVAVWLTAWWSVEQMSVARPESAALRRLRDVAVPAIFGVWLLVLWEILTRGLGVPPVLLPPPSAVGVQLVAQRATLWADFQQTFLTSVLIGWAIGCASGFLVALAVDRVPFLRRGLLPVGNLVSALPIIGVAPIMVMWFGFDWQSKAAVVVIMTFFPMLVNTLAGLDAAGRMERDLMRTYAASHLQELTRLRLPAAMPFVFNALKINSTLALIGAIVAEFFGTPTVGMGFRISTEVGRMAIDMVWAEIAVAAVAGSLFYWLVSIVERAVTFWHPSFR
jgi:NitT/TauT family transport system permease protein